VLPIVGMPFPSTDLSAQVAEAQATGAQAIVVVGLPTEAVQVLEAARSLGVSQKILILGATFPQKLVTQLGSAANGVYTVSSFLPLSAQVPAMNEFKSDMARYAAGQELSDLSLNSWAAVHLFAIAAGRAKSITAAGILQVMPTLKNVNLGITGTFSYGQPGLLPQMPRLVNLETFSGQVKDETIVPTSTTPVPSYP